MLSGLRAAYLFAAVVLLTILPVNQTSVILALFIAVDLAAAALFLTRATPRAQPAVFALGDNANLPLLRRTVPGLRSRRPAVIIEAQVQWRQAAEFRRRRHVLAQHSNP